MESHGGGGKGEKERENVLSSEGLLDISKISALIYIGATFH